MLQFYYIYFIFFLSCDSALFQRPENSEVFRTEAIFAKTFHVDKTSPARGELQSREDT